ncbi:MAG: cytochrome P450 [Rhizomicrobium sp.]
MTDQTTKERDFFTDRSVLLDPYSWLDESRAKGRVRKLDSRDVLMVTGFGEASEVLLNNDAFSSAIAAAGPTAPLPFEPRGNDITDQIAEHHHKFVGSESFISYDGERHAASRSLLRGLFLPSRLRANEDYMRELADRMVIGAVSKGQSEIISELATPYVTLVIADLLGVPEEDRASLFEIVTSGPQPGSVDDADAGASLMQIAQKLGKLFFGYIEDRRANPRSDVLTELATAKYPDGSIPATQELVILAIFLFAAGQDTSAKLLGNAIRYLAENTAMQATLREYPVKVPEFIEEMLRLEGSTKVTFRLARKDTQIGDMAIPAGTRVVASLAGANRDPQRWEDPNAFVLGRPRIMEHLAFGRGRHTCIGAPLARAEVRAILERLLLQTSRITLSEAHHGPPGQRELHYEPSYIIRGLESLYVELTAN